MEYSYIFDIKHEIKSCRECPFLTYHEHQNVCVLDDAISYTLNSRPKDCPLKPMHIIPHTGDKTLAIADAHEIPRRSDSRGRQ